MLVFVEGGKKKRKNPHNKARKNSKLDVHMAPGTSFLKAQETFCTRKAVAKSRNLWLQGCFILIIILNMTEVLIVQKGFTGLKSFQGFWKTGPTLELNLGHIGGRRTLSHCTTLRHLCIPIIWIMNYMYKAAIVQRCFGSVTWMINRKDTVVLTH